MRKASSRVLVELTLAAGVLLIALLISGRAAQSR
jgi:hypothetical protein